MFILLQSAEKIPHVIWKPKFFHSADKRLQLAPSLTQVGTLKFLASENLRFVLIPYFNISTYLRLSLLHMFFFFFQIFQQKLQINIIIIFINCNCVDTWWQWLFYMYTKYEIGY